MTNKELKKELNFAGDEDKVVITFPDLGIDQKLWITTTDFKIVVSRKDGVELLVQ